MILIITFLITSCFTQYTTYTATAYCLRGKTATGHRAGPGIVAVDPKQIKLGSKVHIKGRGTYIARDTGRLIKGRRIDIWMPCKAAIKFGRRKVQVKVYANRN